MDLTDIDIMDFLNEMNDGSGLDTGEDENMSAQIDSTADLSPLQRSRANTWHGNRSIVKSEPPSSEKESRTTTESTSGEGSTLVSNKHLGVDHSSSVISRKSISRRNAWGNFSYADMITKAINSSPEKRMTLSEIYNWMVQNIPFFKDKGDTNSSAGWKNSIRHNLSLHSCFMRVQNEGTGKSSWWMINPDYKATKLPRRRAVTMDNSKALSLHQRKARATRKTDSLGSSDSSGGTISKSCSSSSDLNFMEAGIKTEVTSSEDVFLSQDFRPRSSSNSVKTLRLSPTFEDDGPLEQIASWPVSETFEMDVQQPDFNENQEYLAKMFQSPNNQIQSPQSNISSSTVRPIPIVRTSTPGSVQHPSSLPVPSNMPQAWNYEEREHSQFSKQNNYKNIRASEHMLMSGGGLVTPGHKNMMRNIHWTGESPNSTPLLRDYLSRDDFDAKLQISNQGIRSDVIYHQKLYSGGGHKVSPHSPGFSSTSVNAASSWQQHQEQHPNHSNHGLLLQLLTDNSQQQIPESKTSPHQHTQTFSHSPTNQSMLQHLLTIRQKCHRQVLPGSQQQYRENIILGSHQHSPHHLHLSVEHQRLTSPNQLSQHFYDGVSGAQINFQQPPQHSPQQRSAILQRVLRQPSHFVQQVQLQQHQQQQQQQQPSHKHSANVLYKDPKQDELFDNLLESNFPSDLDFSLLELDSSADIECNIDQVIDHEKKFGEPWDFNFDDDFLLESQNVHESVK